MESRIVRKLVGKIDFRSFVVKCFRKEIGSINPPNLSLCQRVGNEKSKAGIEMFLLFSFLLSKQSYEKLRLSW